MFLGLVIANALILPACGSKDNPVQNPSKESEMTPELTISSDNPTLSSEGGSATISFKSSSAWTATTNVDWITLSQAQGTAGNISLTVTVLKNEEYDQRDGLVVISSGDITKSISITQKQMDALLITSNSIILDEEGGTPSFEVKSNITFSCKVEEEATSWISIVSTRALTTATVTLSIGENLEPYDRQGNVIVYSGDKLEVVTVYQKAKASGSTTSLSGTSWYFNETRTNSGNGYGYSYYVTNILSFRTDGTFICTSSKIGMVDPDSSSSIDYYFGTYESKESGFIVRITGYQTTSGRVVDYCNCTLSAEIIDNVLYLFTEENRLYARFFKL